MCDLPFFFWKGRNLGSRCPQRDLPEVNPDEVDIWAITRTTLLEALDKLVVVMLIDDQMLIGRLRSIDQFNNLVLLETVERICIGKEYGDIDRGVLVVRGENILLVGDYDAERAQRAGLTDVGIDRIVELRSEILRKNRTQDELRRRFYRAQGLSEYTERERFQMQDY